MNTSFLVTGQAADLTGAVSCKWVGSVMRMADELAKENADEQPLHSRNHCCNLQLCYMPLSSAVMTPSQSNFILTVLAAGRRTLDVVCG